MTITSISESYDLYCNTLEAAIDARHIQEQHLSRKPAQDYFRGEAYEDVAT